MSVYSLYAAYTYKKAVNDIAKVFLCFTFLCVLIMLFMCLTSFFSKLPNPVKQLQSLYNITFYVLDR